MKIKYSSLDAAIAELEISLGVVKNNEPINRAEGNISQADLEAESAESFEEALAILESQLK